MEISRNVRGLWSYTNYGFIVCAVPRLWNSALSAVEIASAKNEDLVLPARCFCHQQSTPVRWSLVSADVDVLNDESYINSSYTLARVISLHFMLWLLEKSLMFKRSGLSKWDKDLALAYSARRVSGFGGAAPCVGRNIFLDIGRNGVNRGDQLRGRASLLRLFGQDPPTQRLVGSSKHQVIDSAAYDFGFSS